MSHRQYRNLGAKDAGWKSLSEAERDQSWRRWRFKLKENRQPAGRLTFDSELASDYVTVKRRRESRPPRRSPQGWVRDPQLEPLGGELQDSAIGRLLIGSGLADEGETWGAY